MADQSTTTGSPRLERQIKRLQYGVIAVGAIVLASTIGGLLVAAEWKVLPGSIAAVSVFGGVVLTWRKTQVEDRLRKQIDAAKQRSDDERKLADELARAAKERSAIVLGYNMSEVLATVDRLAREDPVRRNTEIAAVRQSAVVQTKEGVSASDPRAAYFRLEDPASPTRVMRADKAAYSPEREDRFRTEFEEALTPDSNVWGILDGTDPTNFVVDIDADPNPRLDGTRGRAYKTFITARVAAGNIGFGILTVNATRAGSLVPEDKYLVEAIARVLGLAELLCLSTQNYRQYIAISGRNPTTSVEAPTIGSEHSEEES